MKTLEKSILIDCERMKYPFTGLYSFCYFLTKALINNNNGRQLSFYRPQSAETVFANQQTLTQNPLHKFILPKLGNYKIWHNTYQDSRYFPTNRKLKIILTIHDINFMYDENKSKNKKGKYLAKLQEKINRADHIVTISEYSLEDVKKYLQLNNTPVSVIYNGCSLTTLTKIEEPASLPKTPFLFTIGTIIEKKNFHVLPALLQNNDMVLVVAGITQNQSYKDKIINEAQKMNVADRVIFTGAISENDKQWYYKNCTAFVFPSISEGFGLPVVEAMHFGRPVLLSTLTSLPEIGGKEAYYFKSFDAADMQQTMLAALDDFNNNNRAEAIISRAKFFNWDNAAEQYLQLYDKLSG